MHDVYDKYLCKRYPEMFIERNLSMQVTCMCWGFECGNGWFNLLDSLCRCVTQYCKNNDVEIPRVTQVKEKFGTLRFYTSHSTEAINYLVSYAEDMSAVTCMHCGAVGKMYKESWVHCSCESCHSREHPVEHAITVTPGYEKGRGNRVLLPGGFVDVDEKDGKYFHEGKEISVTHITTPLIDFYDGEYI